MQVIRKRVYGFGILTCASLTVCCAMIYIFNTFDYEFTTQLLLGVLVVGSGLLGGLWMKEYKRLKTAGLIAQNQIIHIRPAVICEQTGELVSFKNEKGIEVFISYFGILLDSKIIKFNQDGISLKAVEIGRDFISLTYGTDQRVQNTRLLWATMENGELERIIERFRYETGIVPTIIN